MRKPDQWWDQTWNPITGCSPVSAGCEHCWARRVATTRLRGRHGYDAKDPFRVTFHTHRLAKPVAWRDPRRIFTCGMGDLFHEDVTALMIDICLSTISLTPQHTYFVLTKRAEAINAKLYEPDETAPIRVLGPGDWYENLWIGVSAETNDLWIERWTALCRSGWQGKKFVSLEPLLRPVTFLEPITRMRIKGIPAQEPDWVIVGAETGSGHRSMELDWARDIRNPCVADHIPFFFKRDSDGSHLLDGRAWEQFPEGLQDGR